MKKLLILLALAALPASSAKADLVIDNFNTAQSITTSTTTSSQIATGGALGGFRELILTMIPGGASGTGEVNTSPSGRLLLSTPNGQLAKLTVNYDGNITAGYAPSIAPALNVATLGGIALRAANDFGDFVGVGGAKITFTLSSAGGNNSVATINLIESGGAFLNYTVPFVSFVGTANLSAVTGIQMTIETQDTSEDVTITQLSFTPAPSGIVLGGMALAIGGFFAWRRRSANTLAAV